MMCIEDKQLKIASSLCTDLLSRRKDILDAVPLDKRIERATDTSGFFLEQSIQKCRQLELDFVNRQLSFRGRNTPSYVEVFALCGQMLDSLKRKYPELFPQTEK